MGRTHPQGRRTLLSELDIGRSRSQLAPLANRPSPRLGICSSRSPPVCRRAKRGASGARL
eukprot:8139939-Alexandrium_andersonii.AAC.1